MKDPDGDSGIQGAPILWLPHSLGTLLPTNGQEKRRGKEKGRHTAVNHFSPKTMPSLLSFHWREPVTWPHSDAKGTGNVVSDWAAVSQPQLHTVEVELWWTASLPLFHHHVSLKWLQQSPAGLPDSFPDPAIACSSHSSQSDLSNCKKDHPCHSSHSK